MSNEMNNDKIQNNKEEKPLKSQNLSGENFNNGNENEPFFKKGWPVYITQDVAIFVNIETGEILGPIGEGTLGIILYGGNRENGVNSETGRLTDECAIRIPRLLQSDRFLNFNIAEIAYYEGKQAVRFRGKEFLLGANNVFRLRNPNGFTRIPTNQNGKCYIGFYLATNSKYKICLVSEGGCWPEEFNKYVGDRALFKDIEKYCNNQTDQFDNVLFYREEQSGNRKKNDDKLEVISREGIQSTFREKNINGWWFNLPIAIYPWMSCDLERILTAYLNHNLSSSGQKVDEAPQTEDENDKIMVDNLLKWKLPEWFKLFSNLTTGILNLHTDGCIHGDPRPANIMTKISPNSPILASSFRWIDIALGYDTNAYMELPPPESKNTVIVPRPLGGGRTTPFYAPERTEGLEYEDADSIKLTMIDEGEYAGKFQLTFLYKHNTFAEPKVLELITKEGNPLCELGTLNKGDRIQIKEYVFVVEKVREADIIISRIFELALERLLIDVSSDKESRRMIVGILNNGTIPRYRVFRQWSEATDIYGLGVTILYVLYMIGLAKIKYEVKTTMVSHREEIFHELICLLRNKSFLKSILNSISSKGYKDFESLCTEEVLKVEYTDAYMEKTSNPPDSGTANGQDEDVSKKVSAITDVILSSDSNLEIILYGLKQNIGLFVQVLYFILRCLWREEDFNGETLAQNHDFKPFCDSKTRIRDVNKRKDPAATAYDAIEKIQMRVALLVNDQKPTDPGQSNSHILVHGRIEQMIALNQKITELNQQIEERNALFEKVEYILGKENLINRHIIIDQIAAALALAEQEVKKEDEKEDEKEDKAEK